MRKSRWLKGYHCTFEWRGFSPSMSLNQWQQLCEWVYGYGVERGTPHGLNNYRRKVTAAITRGPCAAEQRVYHTVWFDESGPIPTDDILGFLKGAQR